MKNLKVVGLGIVVLAGVFIVACGNSDPLFDTELKGLSYYRQNDVEADKKREWCLKQIDEKKASEKKESYDYKEYYIEINKMLREKFDDVNYNNCYYAVIRFNRDVKKIEIK